MQSPLQSPTHPGGRHYTRGTYRAKCSRNILLKTLKQCTRNVKKTYKCGTCSAQFGHKGSLKLHIRTHNGEKPHKCDTCGATFAQKAALNVHVRTHTGEKHYVCDTCGVAFAHSESLKIHNRIHTGEKLYNTWATPDDVKV